MLCSVGPLWHLTESGQRTSMRGEESSKYNRLGEGSSTGRAIRTSAEMAGDGVLCIYSFYHEYVYRSGVGNRE